MVRLVAVAIVMIACTDSSEPSDTTLAEVPTTSSLAPTITLLPPPEIDLGVDFESGVLRLAVVGQISDDMWAGHLAYWDSVNDDLGGVGGRFEVELVAVDSIREAMAVGALAVGIDVGDDAGTVLELLVATQAGSAHRRAFGQSDRRRWRRPAGSCRREPWPACVGSGAVNVGVGVAPGSPV